MGSQSDWATLRHAAETLERLAVPHESAHRLGPPHAGPAARICHGARERGLKVIIAGAGGAAHLPGMCAAWTPLPVLGVPVESAQPQGHGQPSFDRADARRRPGRHPGDRPRRGGERGAAGRRDPRHRRRRHLAARLGCAARRRADATPWRTSRPARRHDPFPLPPNATIGLVGGGQLGRMSALAAARLGYRCHILTREQDSPASQVSAAAPSATITSRTAFAHLPPRSM